MTITTATAVYEDGHYVASIIVNAHPGTVHKALFALGIDTVQPTFRATGAPGSTLRIPLVHVVLEDVAQAVAEAMARAIAHVLPTLEP